MAEIRHRTVLEVAVDDRDLRKLGPAMERTLNPRAVEAFEKSMERTSRALQKIVEQQTRLSRLLDEGHRKQQARDREDDRRMRDFERRMTSSTARGSFMGTLGANMLSRSNQLAGQMPYREGFLAQMLSAIPVLGPAFGGAVGGAMSFWGSYTAQQQARARAFGATGLSNAAFSRLAGVGYQYGMGPSELPGFLAQLGGATGMRGAGLSDLAPRALQLQSLMGIDAGASGSLINAMLTAGGGAEDEQRATSLISNAVADGIDAGVREGRLGEVMQQIGSVVTQLRTQGMRIDVTSTLGLMRGLGSLGGAFTGEAGAAAARNITQGMASSPDRQSVLSAVAIRRRMQESGEDYERAAEWVESNPVLAFRSAMEVLSGAGRGSRGFATFLRRDMQRAGINISRAQARQLAELDPEEFLQESTFTETDTRGDYDPLSRMLADRAALARGHMRVAAGEAQYEGARAAIGSRMGGTVHAYRSLELQMIRAFQPMVQRFARRTIAEVRAAFEAYQQGGIGGLVQHLLGRLMSAIPEALQSLGSTILEAFGVNSEEVANQVVEGISPEDARRGADIDEATAAAIESVFGRNALSDFFRDAARIQRNFAEAQETPSATQRGLQRVAPPGTVVGYTADGMPIYAEDVGPQSAVDVRIHVIDGRVDHVEVARG